MKTIMNDSHIKTLEQLHQFLEGTAAVELCIDAKEDRYTWIQSTLVRFHYLQLNKADKGLILSFPQKVSGYSRIQIKRLVKQDCKTGRLQRRQSTTHGFPRKYSDEDIRLLARTDELHGTLSGPTTKKLCERAWVVFGQQTYQPTDRHFYRPSVQSKAIKALSPRAPSLRENPHQTLQHRGTTQTPARG